MHINVNNLNDSLSCNDLTLIAIIPLKNLIIWKPQSKTLAKTNNSGISTNVKMKKVKVKQQNIIQNHNQHL